MITATVLPALPAGYHEGFDLYQFAFPKYNAVSQKTGISFNDYGRMHTIRRAASKWQDYAPVWAMDDSILREVLMTYYERRQFVRTDRSLSYKERMAHVKRNTIIYTKNWERILDELLNRAKEHGSKDLDKEIQNVDSKIVLERRGFPAIVASAVYLRYRCGWTSTAVANEIGMKPPHCRILFWRLNNVYKQMISGKPYRRRGVGDTSKQKVWTPEMVRDIKALRANGWPWRAIASEFDTSRESVMQALYRHTLAKV